MSELLIDEIKYPIITFDKEVISFNIEPSENPDKHGIYGKSESVIFVKNLISDSIALRVKTTKKDLFQLSTAHLILKPGELVEIKFIYTIKDLHENTETHKFKFEAIIISKEYKQFEVKTLFNYLSKNKINVKGTTIKKFVEIREPLIQTTEVTQRIPSDEYVQYRSLSSNRSIDIVLEKELQDIKIEYYKYKRTLSNLVETNQALNSRYDSEKIQIKTFKKELSLPETAVIAIILISILLGYYLST